MLQGSNTLFKPKSLPPDLPEFELSYGVERELGMPKEAGGS